MTAVTAKKDGSIYPICSYIYDKQGLLARLVDGQNTGRSCTYGYDLTGRLCEAAFDDGTAYRYTYDANDCLTKEAVTTADGIRTVNRTYDADSRETVFACGTAKVEKTYDKLGRLQTVKRHNGSHTTTYTYQTAADGGRTGRVWKVTNGSDTFEYGYDDNGNVINVRKNGQAQMYYNYDASGIRTSKTVNGVKTEYLTAGSGILSEKKGNTWQHYLYDGNGQLHAIRYNGADYYYVRDGLMNIIGLVDSSGNTVVSYSYDSWGKILGITGSMAATLGADNPFRYKGYYYDEETSLYYSW